MTALSRQRRMLEASLAELHDNLWRIDTAEPPPTLAEALADDYGTVKAIALAEAYDSFCEHKNRDRFASEVRRIKSCHLADIVGHGRVGEG